MAPARSSAAPGSASAGALRRGVVATLALAPALLAATPAWAQRAEPAAARRPGIDTSPDSANGAVVIALRAAVAPTVEREARPAQWWAPVASAVAPGVGQAVLRQDRWIAFAAVEGVAWLRYAADRQEARREQRSYQRIASQVARALFTTGAAPGGSFEYYETMEKWVESGVYDAQPGGEIDPETDATTFNGSMWLLARQTYWVSPDEPPPTGSEAWVAALAFYQRRAIPPEQRWSWRNAQLQQDLYRRAILRSNAAYRRAAEDLAAVLANHVLSTVDAYVTVRLRRRPGAVGMEHRLEASLPWPGHATSSRR
jgi:hypothetical protein